MNPLPYRWLAAALVSTALAAPVLAQESAQPGQQQSEPAAAPAPVRQAQPRAAAPRAQGPRAESPRGDSRREAAREGGTAGTERTRGSDAQGRVRAPQERAVPRATPPPAATTTPSEPRADSGRDRAPSAATAGEEQRRAQPRGSRPRGDNPAVGRAEPRDGRWDGRGRDDGRRGDGRRGTSIYRGGYYGYRGPVYNNYYYYPRRWYPYGYGAFGLGYFYYDPYTWYAHDPFYSRGHYGYYGGGYGGYVGSGSGYYTGELRLRVEPRHAEVYVDGYFAGNVDDFDGTFQALRLEEGPYKIEIVAPGYETLEFDIRIQPGRKITYRGELRPRP